MTNLKFMKLYNRAEFTLVLKDGGLNWSSVRMNKRMDTRCGARLTEYLMNKFRTPVVPFTKRDNEY